MHLKCTWDDQSPTYYDQEIFVHFRYHNLPEAIHFQSQTHIVLPFEAIKAISAVFGHSVYLRFRDTTTNNALTTIGVVSTMSSTWNHEEKWCVCWGLGTWCYLPTSTDLCLLFFWKNLTFDYVCCLNLDPWYRPCWILAAFHTRFSLSQCVSKQSNPENDFCTIGDQLR